MESYGNQIVVASERFSSSLWLNRRSSLSGVAILSSRMPVFKMDSHALSLHDKKVLLDGEGNAILCAHKAKLISAHDKWEASLGDKFNENARLFRVQKVSAMQFKTHLEVYLEGNDTDRPDFTVKGNYLERQVQIFQGDTNVIAEIKRKFSAANVVLDKHTFTVLVWPNVDQAFIATLVVIMDEIQD